MASSIVKDLEHVVPLLALLLVCQKHFVLELLPQLVRHTATWYGNSWLHVLMTELVVKPILVVFVNFLVQVQIVQLFQLIVDSLCDGPGFLRVFLFLLVVLVVDNIALESTEQVVNKN